MNLKRTSLLFLVALGAGLQLGCGGSPTPQPKTETASYRILQGMADRGTVNFTVDGHTLALPFLANTGYLALSAGTSHQFTAVDATTGSALSQSPWTATLAANSRTTQVLDGCCTFNGGGVTLSDDNTAASGSVKLRIVQGALASPGVLALDVFIMPAGNPPSGTPFASNLNFNAVTSYDVLVPGSYDVIFTNAGTTTVVFDTGPLTFSADQNRTLVLVQDCPGGVCDLNSRTFTLLSDLN